VEPQEAERYHPAITDIVRGHGGQYSLEARVRDRPEEILTILTLQKVADRLLPIDDFSNVETIEGIHSMADKSIGTVEDKEYILPTEIIKGVSPDSTQKEKVGRAGAIQYGYMYRAARTAEMRDPQGTLKAGHLASLFERLASSDYRKVTPDKVMRTMREGARLYKHRETGTGLFVFDRQGDLSSKGYKLDSEFAPFKERYEEGEVYQLADEEQIDVLNILYVKEILLRKESQPVFFTRHKGFLDQFPEGTVVSKKGFLVMPGENETEVEERYFDMRDRMAEKMQQEMGKDEPLTEKQAREALAAERERSAELERKLAEAEETSKKQREDAVKQSEEESEKAIRLKADNGELQQRLQSMRELQRTLEHTIAEAMELLQGGNVFGKRAETIAQALAILQRKEGKEGEK